MTTPLQSIAEHRVTSAFADLRTALDRANEEYRASTLYPQDARIRRQWQCGRAWAEYRARCQQAAAVRSGVCSVVGCGRAYGHSGQCGSP